MKPEDVIENSRVRPQMLRDGAYALLSWLIKPCNFRSVLTCAEKLFNKRLFSANVTVERAFDILKSGWRCILGILTGKKLPQMKLQHLRKVHENGLSGSSYIKSTLCRRFLN